MVWTQQEFMQQLAQASSPAQKLAVFKMYTHQRQVYGPSSVSMPEPAYAPVQPVYQQPVRPEGPPVWEQFRGTGPPKEGEPVPGSTEWIKTRGTVETPPELVTPTAPSEVPPTVYKTEFGYMPTDPDYQKIYAEIEATRREIGAVDISAMESYKASISAISAQQRSLRQVQESPEGSTWTIGGEEYSKAEAVKYLQSNIAAKKKAMIQAGQIPKKLRAEEVKLREQEEWVRAYEREGYEIEITSEGYQPKLPPIEDVHEFVYPGERGTQRLVGVSAMELGIPTMVAGIAGVFDKKYAEAERERLMEKSLSLTMKKGEELGGYSVRFWTSPEAIESVYLPIATVGLGEAYTLIKGGATGTITTGRVAALGAKYGTSALKTFEHGMLIAGVGGSVISGVHLGVTAATKPERLPSATGQVAFGWLIAGAGFKAGEHFVMRKFGGTTPQVYTKLSEEMRPSETFVESMKEIEVQPVAGEPGKYTYRTMRGAMKQVSPTGEVIYGKPKIAGEVYIPEGTELAFTRAVATVEVPMKGGGTQMKVWDVFGVAKPKMKVGKISLDVQAVWMGERATGIITKAGTYAYTKPTGLKVELPTGKFTQKFDVSTNIFGKQMMKSVGPREFVETGKASFTQYESQAISKYWGEEGVIGHGIDYSKIYIRGVKVSKPGGAVVSGGKSLTQTDIATELVGKVSQAFVTPSPKLIVSSKPSISTTTKVFVGTVEEPSGAGAMLLVRPVARGQQVFQQPVQISRPVAVTKQLTGQLTGMRTGIRQVSLVGPVMGVSRVTELLSGYEFERPTLLEPIGVQEYGQRLETRPILETVPLQTPVQELNLEQAQRMSLITPQITELELERPVIEEPIIELVTPVAITPILLTGVTPFGELGKQETPTPYGPRIGRGVGFPELIGRRKKAKSILADLLSVTRSQAWYGIATHPRPTRETFTRGRKSMFMHVPTEEILELGRPKRKLFGNNLMGGKEIELF